MFLFIKLKLIDLSNNNRGIIKFGMLRYVLSLTHNIIYSHVYIMHFYVKVEKTTFISIVINNKTRMCLYMR